MTIVTLFFSILFSTFNPNTPLTVDDSNTNISTTKTTNNNSDFIQGDDIMP